MYICLQLPFWHKRKYISKGLECKRVQKNVYFGFKTDKNYLKKYTLRLWLSFWLGFLCASGGNGVGWGTPI